MTLDLPPFTLIGATTRTGLLTTPLRERFGVCHRLEHYPAGDLAQIVERSAAHPRRGDRGRGRGGDRRACARHAARRQPAAASGCATSPRCARTGAITEDVADEALEMLEVDAAGLERLDREILRTIVEKFDGGPVGLSTLAVAVGEERDTIEDVYEPYLLQRGPDQAHPARPRRDRRAPTSTSASSRRRAHAGGR